MQVIWWASEAGRARLLADGRTVADNRAAFFETADVVSVHVRLVPETRGIITKTDLMSMREDALFVNTSRAAVIEAGALLGALNAGRPAQAALDVFDQEPIKVANDPIATHPRVICTPHIGFVTEDELNLQFDDIFAQVAAFAEGTPIHVINPAAA
jgi:D-3-phosphoglycerate dehydrogenase